MSEKYTKEFLIRELAARASFTAGDVRILWNEFEKLVEEIVKEHGELMIGGLFKVYSHKILKHKAWDISTQSYIEQKDTYRLTITPSSTLRKLAKDFEEDASDDNTSPPDEEE